MDDTNVQTALEKLEFEVVGRNREVSSPSGRLEMDYIVQRNGYKYVVEAKQVSNPDSFLNTTFFRAWTHVNACAKQMGDHQPLIVVEFQEPLGSRLERFLSLFDRYAPECSWIAVEQLRPLRYRIHKEGDVDEETRPEEDLDVEMSTEETGKSLRFSDLELWMFKNMLYSQFPPDKGGDDFPDSIPNGNQLSEKAEVSLPTVYDWISAMEDRLFLKRKQRSYMKLVNVEEYLNEWTRHYRMVENRGRLNLQFIRSTEHPVKRLQEVFNHNDVSSSEFAITGHAGARIYDLAYSTAEEIHLFRFHNRMNSLQEKLGLVPVEESDVEPDVISYQPRFSEAVQRGVTRIDGIPVVDPLQLYLDCYHLSERGREQAEYLLRKLFPDLNRR